MTAWRRPADDMMDGRVHAAIINRDRMCFMVRVDPSHTCADEYGTPHAPDDVLKLTVDHVKERPKFGQLASYHDQKRGAKRAPSDAAHGVAMCGRSNVAGPSHAVREKEREHLATFYPAVWRP